MTPVSLIRDLISAILPPGNQHDSMNSFTVVYVLACLALCYAQTGPLDMYGLINVLYMKADKNYDGEITRQELDDVFKGFDLDRDGSVTMKEFTGLWKSITHQTQEHAEAFFHLADLNDDNVINQQDLPGLYHLFDLDGDGHVTAKNFADKWAGIIQETPFAVLFERADANEDNYLEPAEFNNFFMSFDTTHDNVVSKAEFEHGWTSSNFGTRADADHVFALVDKDHNNEISNTDMSSLYSHYNHDSDAHLSILETAKMANLQPTVATP